MSAEESDSFVVLSFHLLRVISDDSAVSYKVFLKVKITFLLKHIAI